MCLKVYHLIFLLLGLSLSQQVSVNANEERIHFDVEKFQLSNGLTVLLHEDHSVPLISYHTWFRVGSRMERPGSTGIAHLFEHLMFKGTEKYSDKAFEEKLRQEGATHNAFTSKDYTGYYINLPSTGLELVMDLESDRMQFLQVTADHLNSERDVVKEERRFRVENSITGTINELMFLTAFQTHPYRFPIIGLMEDLGQIDVEKCKSFFKQYYAPNNAVIVIAGDFDSRLAKRLINKYYGKIPSQPINQPLYRMEAPQKKPRSKVVFKDVQNESIALGYHVSKAGNPDSYALDLLSEIFSGNKSSRLYKRLVYQSQLASAVSMYAYTPKDPGLLQIFVSLKPGKSVDSVLKIIAEELKNAREKLLSDDELERAKTAVLLSYINSMKTLHGKAQSLAVNEIIMGDYRFFFQDIQRYSQVSAHQIRQVAKKYLNLWQQTLIHIKPQVKPKNKKGRKTS